ncbi:MAG: hypothetical protein J6K21_03565 [Bacilli bacterium]|nr:hypothetical protein [Bacilli bacterium]
MEEIFKLNLVDYIKKIQNMSDSELEELISSEEFKNAENHIINSTFNFLSKNLKKFFIENQELLFKLLKSIQSQKIKFNVIDNDTQYEVIKNIEPFLKLNDIELYNIVKSMNKDVYELFINNLNNYIYNNDVFSKNSLIVNINNLYNDFRNNVKNSYYIEQLIQKIKNDFNINNDELAKQISYNFLLKNRNIFELYRVKTYNQLYIYNKFNIVVSEEIFNDENQDKYNISLELLEILNNKHVIKIIQKLKEKEKYDNNDKIFITAIKLYCLFGLDNALKVINDNFTYSTNKSLEKAANFNFLYERRNYRINNQDEFYSYETIEKLKKALQNNEKGFIKKISSNGDTVYVNSLFEQLKENYTLYKNDQKMLNYLNETIKNEINEREKNIKSFYTANYYQNNSKKRNPLTCEELFNIFSEYDCFLTKFDQNGNVVMDSKIRDLLLDNEKKDNDCLLRMFFNNQLLNYDVELINIINEFDKIDRMLNLCKENKKTFSEKELLNILDVHKILKFNLDVDEKDIPLSALSKTIISKKHLTINENEALKEFKKIFKENRKKNSSTIPKAKGVTKNNIRYKVLDKNDIELLTCGIDVGSCFKPGALGGEFYKYALTSKYSDVIGIWDNNNNFYMCPIIRNGNGIYGNGIDPDNINKDTIPIIIEALKKCYSEIIKKSDKTEKIDFCTITNLHNYINDNSKYEKIKIKNIPIIDNNFYCDFIKNDIVNYILVGNANNIKEYRPKIEYLIPRQKNYVFSKEQNQDKLIIEERINEIEYNSLKQNNQEYSNINIDDYIYVVCNEDWYIALREDFSLKTACLSYDKRAKDEYLRELMKVKLNYELYSALDNKEHNRR